MKLKLEVDGHEMTIDYKNDVKLIFEHEDGKQTHYTVNHERIVCDEIEDDEIQSSWWQQHGDGQA